MVEKLIWVAVFIQAEPEESTTLVNIVLKDEIAADEATQEITTEQPDSHPLSTQSGF